MGLIATYSNSRCSPRRKTHLKKLPANTGNSSGLNYYGYRYYDSTTGRWPSRDPIEEKGGLNLYGFLRKNAINDVDVFGNMGFFFRPKKPKKTTSVTLFRRWIGYTGTCTIANSAKLKAYVEFEKERDLKTKIRLSHLSQHTTKNNVSYLI